MNSNPESSIQSDYQPGVRAERRHGQKCKISSTLFSRKCWRMCSIKMRSKCRKRSTRDVRNMGAIGGVQRITRMIAKGHRRMKTTGSKCRIWVKFLQEDEIKGMSEYLRMPWEKIQTTGQSGPPSAFLNTILFDHSCTLLFIHGPWLLLHHKPELNSCNGDHVACKVEVFYLTL